MDTRSTRWADRAWVGIFLAFGIGALALGYWMSGTTVEGAMVWVDDWRHTRPFRPLPFQELEGSVYLLLEEHYDDIGYAGAPKGYWFEYVSWDNVYEAYRARDDAMPDGWSWGSPMYGPGTEYLRSVPLRADGTFTFHDVPRGRHTVFVEWSGMHARNAYSGPYEVLVTKPGTCTLEVPIGQFDIVVG